jgi:hypothetical protein
MQQRHATQNEHAAPPEETVEDTVALAQAIELICAKQYRQGERFLARYSSRYQPLFPDTDYLRRRGVDLVAFAKAIGKGLDLERFGEVIQFKDWPIDEFNRFNASDVSCDHMNAFMRRYLADPRHW